MKRRRDGLSLVGEIYQSKQQIHLPDVDEQMTGYLTCFCVSHDYFLYLLNFLEL